MSNETKEENIFDLTKLVPQETEFEVKKPVKIINQNERENLLKGFTELPNDKWDTLSPGNFIRYLRKDGAFRIGGTFKNSWVNSHGKNQGKKSIQLYANNKSFTTWNVILDDVETIWIRDDINSITNAENSTIKEKMNNQEETIDYLKNSVQQMKTDIQKINNEQKRIINLIKKLHGIK